jgi:hypothetical protein
MSATFVNLLELPIRIARIQPTVPSSDNDLSQVSTNVNSKLIHFSQADWTGHLPPAEMMPPS